MWSFHTPQNSAFVGQSGRPFAAFSRCAMPPQYPYPSKRASVTEVERSSAHASMMPHNSYGECEESYILMHSEYSISWWGEGEE